METLAVYYLSLLPGLRDAARACGYALAVHGSMDRDFDLVAVPWTDDASSAEELVEAVCTAVDGHFRARTDGGPWPREKPHGRRAWAIRLSGTAYIDLSVMPRTES